MKLLSSPARIIAVLAVGASLLTAMPDISSAQQAGAPPQPSVEVTTVTARQVPLDYTYAARVSAFREVEVRAQVGGILKERAYVEGARVKAGDVLFRIDPASFEAEAARASAQLQTAQAQLSQARRDQQRASELLDRKVGSQKTFDDAKSAVELAEAAVAVAAAQVKTAQINLDHATVRAPIDGVTSLDVVPEGSLIGAGSSDSLLTRITRLDPVYVNFSYASEDAAEIRRIIDQSGSDEGKLSASIVFGDGSALERKGVIDFTAPSLDTQTGTMRVRAVFDNPDSRLIPGQFVRIKIGGLTVPSAIVVPEAAVMQGPDGKFVYTVDDSLTAAVQPITTGRSVEDGWIVTDGLKAGDRIVTSGIIKVRPGSRVAATKSILQTAQAE